MSRKRLHNKKYRDFERKTEFDGPKKSPNLRSELWVRSALACAFNFSPSKNATLRGGSRMCQGSKGSDGGNGCRKFFSRSEKLVGSQLHDLHSAV